MREVLFISLDQQLAKVLRWKLENEGYAVALSSSLEESFLRIGQADPFAVILDARSVPEPDWSTASMLAWFHRRSPIVLLRNKPNPVLEKECDYCFSRRDVRDRLIRCLQTLGSF